MSRFHCTVRLEDDSVEWQLIVFEAPPQRGDVIVLHRPNVQARMIVQRTEWDSSHDEPPVVIVVYEAPPVEPIPEQLDPEDRDEWQLRLDGHADQRHVRAWVRPGAPYGRWKVEIDDEEVPVVRIDRRRDGGTTILSLPDEMLIFPRRIGSDDRTPRLAGVKVE